MGRREGKEEFRGTVGRIPWGPSAGLRIQPGIRKGSNGALQAEEGRDWTSPDSRSEIEVGSQGCGSDGGEGTLARAVVPSGPVLSYFDGRTKRIC